MWITYPGDFEIWLGNIFNNRRTERGAMFPPFWKQDSHYVTVEFSTTVDLLHDETITISCEGRYNFMLDGKLRFGEPHEYTIPQGHHTINIKVWNQAVPPALFVKGETIQTDSSWLATYEDKIWIDENGVAHGSGIYVPAATHAYFNTVEKRPSLFSLSRSLIRPVSEEVCRKGVLYDFGKETMGYVTFSGAQESDTLHIFYGESREEALDHEYCETLDILDVKPGETAETPESKAFRYVHVLSENGHRYVVEGLSEYLSHDAAMSGSFECSDDDVNEIWKVGAYTMDLTTREFFVDGIKRDRWTWSGDAIQSYLMNYYLRFDTDTVRRTIRQLRGKDPVTAHINTIMDYTFYWFKSILDYYEFTADIDFVREMYPRMLTMMQYVLGRTDSEGFADGRPDDWIFVDWVDFPMHKRGVMAFEQILFAKSLETMSRCAVLLRDNPMDNPPQGSRTTEEYAHDVTKYSTLYETLRKNIDATFWDDVVKAFLHSVEDGEINPMVTKFPNMFAMLFGYVSEERKAEILHNVMLNPSVEAITTPYMRFYELEALCMMGQHDFVMKEIKDYWGGMLRNGATSFWEKYVPGEKGTEHLQMYGRPYGKSLCHAWGASPVYLLGRYFLGVTPVKPGYEAWECRPNLGGLQWMRGAVPTPYGPIKIYMDKEKFVIESPVAGGKVYLDGKCIEIDTTESIEIIRNIIHITEKSGNLNATRRFY